ncbi:unnamed protein product [Rotaria socialis]
MFVSKMISIYWNEIISIAISRESIVFSDELQTVQQTVDALTKNSLLQNTFIYTITTSNMNKNCSFIHKAVQTF